MSPSKDSGNRASAIQASGRSHPLRCLVPFFAQIDATVVNVSLSSLAVELHRHSFRQFSGSRVAYLLALALMLPLNSWMVNRIGAKALYL